VPVVSRKIIRQALGRERLNDTIVANTTASLANKALLANLYADALFSGDDLYNRAWGRYFPSSTVAGVDFRVASFNAGSGAWITSQVQFTSVASGAEFEIHQKLSPADKDRAIDQTIRDMGLVRREVGLQGVADQRFYALASAGSPHRLYTEQVFDAYYYADPSSSLDRQRKDFDWWEIGTTPTGTELRISPAVGASCQVILDALLGVTLGSSDVATIDIPDLDWLLWGAESKAWGMLLANDPGQNGGEYRVKRAEAARMYHALSIAFAPRFDRALPFFDKRF